MTIRGRVVTKSLYIAFDYLYCITLVHVDLIIIKTCLFFTNRLVSGLNFRILMLKFWYFWDDPCPILVPRRHEVLNFLNVFSIFVIFGQNSVKVSFLFDLRCCNLNLQAFHELIMHSWINYAFKKQPFFRVFSTSQS